MKNFYLKIIVFLLIVISTYLSVETYYTYIQNKNFQILNQRSSLIIQLPNTEYIEVHSRNDAVLDNDTQQKPFSTYSKILKNSNLENSIAQTNVHTEYIENGDMNRLVTLTPLSNQYIKIQIDTNTQYTYTPNLQYSIQLDYTNKTEFSVESNTVKFTDKGCTVSVVGENVSYSFTENNQSVLIRKKYEPKMSFKINLNIDCNQ